MSDLLTSDELTALRKDFKTLLGFTNPEHSTETEDDAKSTVTVRRVTSKGPLNPNTYKYDSPTYATIYTGAAYLAPIVFRRDRQESHAGATVRVRQYRALLPWDSGDIRIDDEIVIDTSSDTEMVGRVWLVSDVMYESEQGARRLTITDITAGSGVDCTTVQVGAATETETAVTVAVVT